jgi:hypothetical protein
LLAHAGIFRHQLGPQILRRNLIGPLDLGRIVGHHLDIGGGKGDLAGAQLPGHRAFAQ